MKRTDRRGFLRLAGGAALGSAVGGCSRNGKDTPATATTTMPPPDPSPAHSPPALAKGGDVIQLFLCGDVMTGRGIDQILPHPVSPALHESYVESALEYVEIAERANGPIKKPVSFDYIWGDALAQLERRSVDARIVNLETSVTRSEDWAPKGINYRMAPENVPCLTAARLDVTSLANNHTLDWGKRGLEDTLVNLRRAGLRIAGAGRTLREAQSPAVVEVADKGRVLVFGLGSETSGIPPSWAARQGRPGVYLLDDLSDDSAAKVGRLVEAEKRPRDVVVASIHWGGNWGFDIPEAQRRFAHALIERAHVDVVHGHSSHHAKGIEVYRGKPILYGCGDFINDYEGISGHDEYRDDLAVMYFLSVDPASGALRRLEMTPLVIRRLSLHRASPGDARWLRDTLDREGQRLGTSVELEGEHLMLGWG